MAPWARRRRRPADAPEARAGATLLEDERPARLDRRVEAAIERTHAERLRRLADAALLIGRAGGVDEVLRLATESAREIVGTTEAVMRRDVDGADTVVCVSRVGEQPEGAGPGHGFVAPLVARDGTHIGSLEVRGKVDGSPFTVEDEAVLVQVAQMASVGIENAGLIQLERMARRAAEDSARLRGLLSDVSQAFAASLDLEDVRAAVTDIVVPQFADWCGLTLLLPDGQLQLVAESSVDEALARALAALRERVRPSIEHPHGVGAVVRTGRSEFFPEVPRGVLAELAEASGVDPEDLYRLHIESGIVVPLRARARTIGALTLIRTHAEPYTQEELRFAEDVASRAALAIENATRFTLERQAADLLQRSLLPQALPRVPGMRTAARYLPGGSGTRIGGDWYDVIQLDDRHMAFVVGDVMGRGIPAATVMGQVRATVRAYAQEGHEPARLLDLADVLVERLDQLQLTTCVYGLYDTEERTFTLAGAGHPPPLLVSPGGTAQFLSLEAGLPLGVASLGGPPRTQTVVHLPPGSTLLLYTDGLVEARDCPVDEGMQLLRAAATGWSGAPQELCDLMLKAMGRDGHHDDDTALLALAVLADDGAARPGQDGREAQGDATVPSYRLRTDLLSPGEARRIVTDSLAQWAIGDVDAAVLVAHELVTNAVLHGIGPIWLRLAPRDGGVRIEVADGSERVPVVQPYHEDAFTGRGLALVEALCDGWGWEPTATGKVIWCQMTS